MNWADLQVLLAFSRRGSLQAAGQALGVNHTTVARRLRELEQSLGCKLVENVGGKLALTAAGERALETTSRMSEEALALERELEGHDDRLAGTIRMGILDFMVEAHADAITDFSRQHPGVRLEVRSSSSAPHSLVEREADIAVRVTDKPRDTLVGRRLGTLELAPFVHESLADLPSSDVPWVGWHASVGASMTDDWMKQHLRSDQVRLRVDTTSAMFHLVRAGAGAAILPIFYARSCPGLIQRSARLRGFATDLWILTHRDLAELRRIRTFLQFFANALRIRSDKK